MLGLDSPFTLPAVSQVRGTLLVGEGEGVGPELLSGTILNHTTVWCLLCSPSYVIAQIPKASEPSTSRNSLSKKSVNEPLCAPMLNGSSVPNTSPSGKVS